MAVKEPPQEAPPAPTGAALTPLRAEVKARAQAAHQVVQGGLVFREDHQSFIRPEGSLGRPQALVQQSQQGVEAGVHQLPHDLPLAFG